MTDRPKLAKAGNAALWALQALSAAAFLLAGGAKLYGAPMMIGVFEQIGLGQWFRYVTGGVEMLGGVLLLVPSASAMGALLLAATMVCATLTHLFLIGGSPLPAMVLLVVTSVVCWYRRPTNATRGSDD